MSTNFKKASTAFFELKLFFAKIFKIFYLSKKRYRSKIIYLFRFIAQWRPVQFSFNCNFNPKVITFSFFKGFTFKKSN